MSHSHYQVMKILAIGQFAPCVIILGIVMEHIVHEIIGFFEAELGRYHYIEYRS